jgi:hypothetical protein
MLLSNDLRQFTGKKADQRMVFKNVDITFFRPKDNRSRPSVATLKTRHGVLAIQNTNNNVLNSVYRNLKLNDNIYHSAGPVVNAKAKRVSIYCDRTMLKKLTYSCRLTVIARDNHSL